jgi:hypothetical protein
MVQPLVFVYIETAIISRLTQNSCIKIRNKLHVSAMLSYPQAVSNCIKTECKTLEVILLKPGI